MKPIQLWFALLVSVSTLSIDGFCPRPMIVARPSLTSELASSPRYGPRLDDDDEDQQGGRLPLPSIDQIDAGFRQLLDKIMSVKDPQHVPSILTKNIELILLLSNENGAKMVEAILQETLQQQGEAGAEALANAIELVLSFAENFVEEAARIDKANKELLGDIIRIVSDKERTGSAREDALDDLLKQEKDRITAGFIRHLDGECDRIAGAPKMTKESGRLLEMLRMIQARVLDEIGSDLGEAATVLNQLVGFDFDEERLAVLDAGLSVQGPAYARQMLSLTEQSLQGFERLGADPILVERVKSIDERLRKYLESQDGEFQ
jgi:hypothetical protein